MSSKLTKQETQEVQVPEQSAQKLEEKAFSLSSDSGYTLHTSQEVDEGQVLGLFPTAQETDVGTQALVGTGFTYRHDWGDMNGQWKLNLNWGVIRANSRIFVAIAEGGPWPGKHMGAARYTLHNVVPKNSAVEIWVNIEWSSPIRLYVDYLVVNP